MPTITQALRQEVIARARARCEYCHTLMAVVVELEVDHIIPVSAGGETHLDNLCLACRSCNSFKAAHQSAIDPETGEESLLFNPRRARWHEHFEWSEDGTNLLGLSPIGGATIAQLRMNREAVVEARKRWVAVGWHPPSIEEV